MAPDRLTGLARLEPTIPGMGDLAREALEEMGVRYVVFHLDYYERDEWTEVERRIRDYPDRLRLEAEEASGRVYLLSRQAFQPGREW